MDTLTAAELHDLYAPLWEKVPETRPHPRNGFMTMRLGREVDEGSWVNVMGWDVLSFDSTIAAALCRVAVEDWLLKRGLYLVPIYYVPGREEGRAFQLLGSDVQFEKFWSKSGEALPGPTIHNALVAATLAIADDRAHQ